MAPRKAEYFLLKFCALFLSHSFPALIAQPVISKAIPFTNVINSSIQHHR